MITAAGRRVFKSWLSSAPGPDQFRSPLILRLVHSATLTARQRESLVANARNAYSARLDASRLAARAASDAYAKAAADFGVAHARAALKLLDAIPLA